MYFYVVICYFFYMQNKTIGTSEKRIPQTKKQLQFQFYFIRLLFDAQAAHSRTDRTENILLCSIFETLLFEIQIDTNNIINRHYQIFVNHFFPQSFSTFVPLNRTRNNQNLIARRSQITEIVSFWSILTVMHA